MLNKRSTATHSDLALSVIHTAAEAQALASEWDDLAAHASEENVFYERWMLCPALEHFPEEGVKLVFVWGQQPNGQSGPILIGLFPIIYRQGYHRLQIHYAAMWQHRHCFLCTPLIRQGHEAECLEKFLDWMDTQERNRFFSLNLFGGGDRFEEQLSDFVRRGSGRAVQTLPREQRASLHIGLDPETYFQKYFNSRRRKDIRRKETWLREQGVPKFEALTQDGDVRQWIADFIHLEASGWKGDCHSAIADRECECKFFETVCRSAFEHGRLFMMRLTLDGQPIAMKVSFLGGESAFAFKIAYDERYGKCSPGFLLEMENVRWMLNQNKIKRMDSCALPHHTMLNRLWSERRDVCGVIMSTGSPVNKILMDAFGSLRRIAHKMRPRQVECEEAAEE
jgi:CelD/BcsL family acetyltransferase involved in cellulose biosynthesis